MIDVDFSVTVKIHAESFDRAWHELRQTDGTSIRALYIKRLKVIFVKDD